LPVSFDDFSRPDTEAAPGEGPEPRRTPNPHAATHAATPHTAAGPTGPRETPEGDPAARPGADGAARRLVVLPKHLHARPAGQVAQVAARHRDAVIELVAGERRANARSVLAVMGLGALAGTEVGVVVTGPRADEIADELAGVLRRPEEADG